MAKRDLKRTRREAAEWLIERGNQIAGIIAIVFVLLIFVFLLDNALPVLKGYPLSELLGGRRWSPTFEPPSFGMLPLMLGSLYVTAGALVLSVPLGIACAVFIAEVAPKQAREILKPAVELLAAIPSVVFGFLGMLLIGPWLAEKLSLPVGQFAALGSLILAFMALPTIVSVSEDAIRAVPVALRQSSLALGATRWQTICRVVLPAGRSGIIAAVMLGLGRAIGETMTVLMVTGNAAVIPQGFMGFLRPVRTMTATIAAEMGETAFRGEHYHALFAVGLILLIITFITNTIADVVVRRAGRLK
jgi:phosphate transport system permease protein